jgi:hypothetical protein
MPLKTVYISIRWRPGNVFFIKEVKRIFDTERITKEEVAEEELGLAINRVLHLMKKTADEFRAELEVTISDKKA